MEENQDILKGILQAVFIVLITIFCFSRVSKKHQEFWKLFPIVLVSVWLSVSLFLGVEYYVFRDTNILQSGGIFSLVKEALPMSLIFGGLTFVIRYKRLKNS